MTVEPELPDVLVPVPVVLELDELLVPALLVLELEEPLEDPPAADALLLAAEALPLDAVAAAAEDDVDAAVDPADDELLAPSGALPQATLVAAATASAAVRRSLERSLRQNGQRVSELRTWRMHVGHWRKEGIGVP